MGRSPCCDKVGLKKGPWTPEEDQKLLAYIEEHGHGNWRALPSKAGLQRCGKSCRLRWTNYLRPDIKRGKFSLQEEQTIIQLHALLGNRWSAIATHLPKRTDNEIKNYWNTHLKKRLTKMGIDPVTHKPKNDALLSPADGQTKNAANLSHMAQWESARLEAEARLARQSKLRSNSFHNLLTTATTEFSQPSASSSSASAAHLNALRGWHVRGDGWPKANAGDGIGSAAAHGTVGGDLGSPTSTLSYSENGTTGPPSAAREGTTGSMIEFMGNAGDDGMVKEEGTEAEWKSFGSHSSAAHLAAAEYSEGLEITTMPFAPGLHELNIAMDGFTELLLSHSAGDQRSLSESNTGGSGTSGGGSGGCGTAASGGSGGGDYYEDNSKNYWNNILNLVNSSPSNSALF
ncbi:hypothetical protein Dimus_022136 [Dionaea muscipula]